jgi:hypothetical protein
MDEYRREYLGQRRELEEVGEAKRLLINDLFVICEFGGAGTEAPPPENLFD